MNAIIIDDAPQAIRLLQLMIAEHRPEVQIVGTANSAEEGLKLIAALKPHFIFLDIEMPGKSGVYVAEQLLQQKLACDVIFTTAYNQYAIQAFRLSAIDYLLKPVQEKELIEAIDKVKERVMLVNAQSRLQALKDNFLENAPQTLSIPVHNGFDFVVLKDIEYLEADGSYAHIFLVDKQQKTVSKNLKYLEQALENCPNFVRVHRSFIINIHQMEAFSKSGRGIITMKSGKEIDLARERRAAFFKLV